MCIGLIKQLIQLTKSILIENYRIDKELGWNGSNLNWIRLTGFKFIWPNSLYTRDLCGFLAKALIKLDPLVWKEDEIDLKDILNDGVRFLSRWFKFKIKRQTLTHTIIMNDRVCWWSSARTVLCLHFFDQLFVVDQLWYFNI